MGEFSKYLFIWGFGIIALIYFGYCVWGMILVFYLDVKENLRIKKKEKEAENQKNIDFRAILKRRIKKLFNFYKICYYNIVLGVYFFLFWFFYIWTMLIFLPINMGAFNSLFGDFTTKFFDIVENKIKEIKKQENCIWYKEIIITILIVISIITIHDYVI